MFDLWKLIWCGLVGLFRSRASLEIEILALRHQLNILRCKSPKRPVPRRIDRLVFVGLYRLAPDILSALGNCPTGPRDPLVPRRLQVILALEIEPSRRSTGGPLEIRRLIREMNIANPLW